MSERLQDQNLDGASHSAARFGRLQQAFQKSERVMQGLRLLADRVAGDEHAGEGDVLELAQKGQIVVDGQIRSRTQLRTSGNLPCSTHTRAFSAGMGAMSGTGDRK